MFGFEAKFGTDVIVRGTCDHNCDTEGKLGTWMVKAVRLLIYVVLLRAIICLG